MAQGDITLNLYNNLAWYTDDNRFKGIVSDLEQKADELEMVGGYNSADDKESADYKQKHRAFRKAILFHAKKSGYEAKHPEVLDVDKFFFAGNKINRKALESFEKDIVKDHMYQKHLWEFMGTTGHLSLVSKLALASNGKKTDDLTPISVKGKAVESSPISPILESIPDSVPLYLYADGTVSTLYDKNRAKLLFDTTADKTGFDWKRKGYDPNYDIEHKDLKIVYNPKTGEFTVVKITGDSLMEEVVQIFTPEKASPLSIKVILAENDGAILNDPFYIFVYKKLYEIILQNKKLSEEEEDYRDELLALIDRGLEAVGADKITCIVKSSDKTEEVSDGDVIKAYREVLGNRVAPGVRLISADDAAVEQAKSLDRVIARRDEQEGMNLASKLAYLVGLGLTGPVLAKAVKTSTMPQNASFLNVSDLKEVGFEDEDARAISKFEVPLDKQSAFSKVLFNLMDDYSLLSSAGLSERQVADLVYDSIVNGTKHSEYIELPLTIERICTTRSVIFDGDVNSGIRKEFENEIAALPQTSQTKRLEEKVNNAILRYRVIKEASGMSASEVVTSLVKTSESSPASLPTIRYMSSSDPTSKKFTVRLKFSDIIDSILNSNKVITFLKPIDFSNIETKAKYNLFDSEVLAKWLRSSLGIKSALDADMLTNLVSAIRKSSDEQSQVQLSLKSDLQSAEEAHAQPILVNTVTAELMPTQNIATSTKTKAEPNPLLLGLPLLSSVNSALSNSLIHNFDTTNEQPNNSVLQEIPLQFAYKANTDDAEYMDSDTDSSESPAASASDTPKDSSATPGAQTATNDSKKGLSKGEIAGIAVGSVAGAGLLVGGGVGGYFLYRKLKNNTTDKLKEQANNTANAIEQSHEFQEFRESFEYWNNNRPKNFADPPDLQEGCEDNHNQNRILDNNEQVGNLVLKNNLKSSNVLKKSGLKRTIKKLDEDVKEDVKVENNFNGNDDIEDEADFVNLINFVNNAADENPNSAVATIPIHNDTKKMSLEEVKTKAKDLGLYWKDYVEMYLDKDQINFPWPFN